MMGLQQFAPFPQGAHFIILTFGPKLGGTNPYPYLFSLPHSLSSCSLPTLTASKVSVPPPTPSWDGVHREHFRCQGAEGLYWPSSVNRKPALCFPPFLPLVFFWPSSPWSWLIAGLWCLRSSGVGHRVLAVKGPRMEQGVRRFSQVCIWGGGRASGKWGWDSFPLRGRQLWGWGELTE